jgi:hypothetical protein
MDGVKPAVIEACSRRGILRAAFVRKTLAIRRNFDRGIFHSQGFFGLRYSQESLAAVPVKVGMLLRVIGLSMHRHEGMVARMLQAGAETYLTKDGAPEKLLSAIGV